MPFRFIHTADWQIGKPFGAVPGDAGAELRNQRVRTVAKIAAIARDRDVDAVLVAGDAFDSNDVSDKTIMRLVEALKAYPGPWVFLPGNHDAALAHSVWTRIRALGVPDNIVIADQPVAIERWGERAVVLPAPLTRRHEMLDQTEWFDTATSPEGACRIGLAHGSMADRLPERADSHNEIADTRAGSADLSYLALGDWHGAMKIADRTYYAGTPETDRHRRNRSGLIHLVTTNGLGADEIVEEIETRHYHWVPLDVPLLDGTCDPLVAKLEGIPDPSRSVVQLRLHGSVSLAERRRLDALLKHWDARVHHLDQDLSALHDEPTADDLDAIDTGGFVRQAIDRLKLRAEDGSDPGREAARVALRLMYLDHLGHR